jgi:hypothetical protein
MLLNMKLIPVTIYNLFIYFTFIFSKVKVIIFERNEANSSAYWIKNLVEDLDSSYLKMHNIFFDSIEPEPAFSWWWN